MWSKSFVFFLVSSITMVGTAGIAPLTHLFYKLTKYFNIFHHISIETLRTKDTLRPIFRRCAWSLNLALQGQRPSKVMAGVQGFALSPRQEKAADQPLSYTFAMVEVRAD